MLNNKLKSFIIIPQQNSTLPKTKNTILKLRKSLPPHLRERRRRRRPPHPDEEIDSAVLEKMPTRHKKPRVPQPRRTEMPEDLTAERNVKIKTVIFKF